MSGTSLDGIDTVLCEITGYDESTGKAIEFYYSRYSRKFKDKKSESAAVERIGSGGSNLFFEF